MLIDPLFVHAQSQPDLIAVLDEAGAHTYRQLAGAAAGVATILAMQTKKPHVGLLAPAGSGFVAGFYGTLLADKCVVPINFLLGDREIAHVVADSGIDTVLTIPQLAGRVATHKLKSIDLIELAKLPAPPDRPKFPEPDGDDMAVLMYTSGTSGLPKGVRLSYENLQSDVTACIQHAALQHGHKFLGVIPLFHAFGMTATMLAPIQLGATTTYLGRFSAVAAMNAIRQNKISLVFAVPSMFAALAHLKSAGPEDFAQVYALLSGGEPLSVALFERFRQRYGVPIYEGYGLTETSPVVSLNTPQANRLGSVGKAVPGCVVKIVDENGAALPAGQVGEVWLGGPMIMKGYNNLPEETAAALTDDGFFKTGDLGKIDDDGYIYITGRKKDLIIVAGEKAYPREIEDALLRNAALAEAAVVGKKDESRGEVVVAFVTLKEGATCTADQLREHCRQEGLPQWKIPREIYFEKELPHSPTGKVLKRVLAERANAQ